MALGDTRQSVVLLEEATAKQKSDPRLWNDLAAVYLAQGVAETDPYLLSRALHIVEGALRIDGSLREALFNRALVYEHLHLRAHARAAWSHYLEVDSESPWAVAARSHLELLEVPPLEERWRQHSGELETAVSKGDRPTLEALVWQFTQPMRHYFEETLLANWALAQQRGDAPEAERLRRSATMIAASLVELTGDRLPSDTVAAIERADSGRRLAFLAQAHLAYAQAHELYLSDRIVEARPIFAYVLKEFQRATSPFALWARFYLAACDHKDNQPVRAAALANEAKAHSYLNVVGQTDWLIGLADLEQADAERALRRFREALWAFQTTREIGNQGAIASLVANCLHYVGAERDAWRYRHQALGTTALTGNLAQLATVYGAASRALAAEGDYETALTFEDEILAPALASKNSRVIAEAYWWRAMILHLAKKDRRALEDILRAGAHCSRIGHLPTRRRTLAGISATEGAIRRASDPAGALRALSRALDLYEEGAYAYLLVEIQLERARAFLILRQDDAAERAFEEGIAEFERQRIKLGTREYQVSYFDRAQSVIDEMIAFQLDRRGSSDRAFAVAERSKARNLLDAIVCKRSLGPCDSAPFTLPSIMSRLPRGTVLLEYSVLADRTMIWVVARGTSSFAQIPFGRAALVGRVAALLSAIQAAGTTGEFGDRAKDLSQILLAPVLAQVPTESRLIIVPDKALAGLPFASLRDPHSGRFLIEMHPLAFAPSASTYLTALESAERAPLQARWTSLAVGAPEPDPNRFPELVALDAARDEARDLGAALPGSLTLIGPAATASRFLAEIDRYDVIHYSGHALGSRTDPHSSKLLFSSGPGRFGTGELYARDIEALDLRRPRLVVLAACGTAVGDRSSLEGSSGLASAFLIAGAPAVVADLWDIGDNKAKILLNYFYSNFLRNHDPMLALQKAQIAMIHDDNRQLREPAVWAGFYLLGAARVER